MTNWRPASDPATAERRAAMLERARRYFSEQDLLSVDTPALSRYATTDPNIESFAVSADSGNEYLLHTSPESYMKRLLAGGYPDCYSICRVFRGAEAGDRHAPEFTLVEWYRLGFDLSPIIDDTTRFIAACLDDPALADNVAQYDYADVLQEFAGIDLFTASVDEFAARVTADKQLIAAMGDDRDAWCDLVLSTIVAPRFAGNKLTVIRHFPASQAALARLCPHDERVADRFEVFFGSLELANGYVELTDAVEQRQRIGRDLEARRTKGRRQYAVDEMLLGALESGLPDCAGVSVGVERLQMVLDRTDDIRDVVTFYTEIS